MDREMIKREVILPKLNDCRGDITRQWFVYYSVLNPATGTMKCFRVYNGFTELKTADERRKHGKKLIAKWKRKLLDGWNPFFEQDKVRYKSLIKYDMTARHKGAEVITTRNFEFYSTIYLDFIKKSMARRPGTYTTYKSKLRIFGKFLTEKKIDKVNLRFYNLATINSFNEWLQKERGLQGKSLNDYNEMLKRFFKYLITELKIIKENPVEGCRRYAEKGTHHRAFNDNYIKKLKKEIEHEDPWLWLMCRMIFSCFTRPKELRFLQIRHINWINGTIELPAKIAKNNHDRIITIPQYLMDILIAKKYNEYPGDYYLMSHNRQPGPMPVSKNYLYNKVKPYLVRLKLPEGFTLYSFKHTGVQQLAKKGVDLIYIKSQLGHASLDQMLPYIDELLSQGNDEIRYKAPEI